jgi:hypothetical protein
LEVVLVEYLLFGVTTIFLCVGLGFGRFVCFLLRICLWVDGILELRTASKCPVALDGPTGFFDFGLGFICQDKQIPGSPIHSFNVLFTAIRFSSSVLWRTP